MAKINRSEIIQKAIKDLRLDAARERVPTDTSDKIVLTYNLNTPESEIVQSGDANNATSGTIYTTPSDKDFYVTSVELSTIKDATSTSVYSSVNIVKNGATRPLLRIPGITLTAQNQSVSLSYKNPIKVDRGTAITVTNTSAVANCRSMAIVTGYELGK